MKHIAKIGQPPAYTAWRNEMRGQPNERYPVPNPPRGELVDTLLNEQGFLCAYTMRRITEDSCHIEHIKPESLCRQDQVGSDLDYENMIVCHPKKTEKNKSEFTYGAIYKDAWWDDGGVHFISPLNPQCEIRFNFNLKGEIIPLNADAEITKEVLFLDHKSLTEDRRRTIQEFIYGPKGDTPLSNSKSLQAIDSIVARNHNGEFYVFCIAIKRALQEHIANLAKAAAKKKYVAQQKKK